MHHFFKSDLKDNNTLIDEEFQHCVQVLRHQSGDEMTLTDGEGYWVLAQITEIKKRTLQFHVKESTQIPKKGFATHLFISPTKQVERMEWLVEKAAELRVDEITFLITQNSERRKLRLDRLQKKAISALKQSKSAYLTKVNDLTPLRDCLSEVGTRIIAYVDPSLPYISEAISPSSSVELFVGPEGDFTSEEIQLMIAKGGKCVSLGESVLRTETAGIVSCHTVNLINQF